MTQYGQQRRPSRPGRRGKRRQRSEAEHKWHGRARPGWPRRAPGRAQLEQLAQLAQLVQRRRRRPGPDSRGPGVLTRRGVDADLVQGADAVGVGGVEHGAGTGAGTGVGIGAGIGVGIKVGTGVGTDPGLGLGPGRLQQHQARLLQVSARAGRQELGGAIEAHRADPPRPGARIGARPRPPLPQLLPPPLAGRRPRAVLARHRAARPPARPGGPARSEPLARPARETSLPVTARRATSSRRARPGAGPAGMCSPFGGKRANGRALRARSMPGVVVPAPCPPF